MKISINPSYFCNLRCNFCYYYDWLGDRKCLDLQKLNQLLSQIDALHGIDWIDLYGGEITVLPYDYTQELLKTIRAHYSGTISVITNFVKPAPMFVGPNKLFDESNYRTAVSYDFECRQHHEKVWNNILSHEGDVHVLMVATPCLMEKNVDDMILQLNMATNIRSVDIKSYSSSQHNDFQLPWKDYESFLQRWISSPIPKNFECVVERNLMQCFSGERSSWNDDHVFINPDGKLTLIEYDEQDRELFRELDGIEDFAKYASREKERVLTNPICSTCPWVGRCLTEQYRNVLDINKGCNGFRGLIEWYKAHVSHF